MVPQHSHAQHLENCFGGLLFWFVESDEGLYLLVVCASVLRGVVLRRRLLKVCGGGVLGSVLGL